MNECKPLVMGMAQEGTKAGGFIDNKDSLDRPSFDEPPRLRICMSIHPDGKPWGRVRSRLEWLF